MVYRVCDRELIPPSALRSIPDAKESCGVIDNAFLNEGRPPQWIRMQYDISAVAWRVSELICSDAKVCRSLREEKIAEIILRARAHNWQDLAKN